MDATDYLFTISAEACGGGRWWLQRRKVVGGCGGSVGG